MPIFCKFYRLFDRFNGTPDRKETYTYEGDSTNVAKVAYDDNADGKTDRVALNTYDGNGNLVKTEYHNDGVESNSENRVETNRYDANGNLVQKAIDANGDGQVDTIETYTVNDKGQRTGTSYADANGNVYKSETYVLNNNGNWLEKHVNEDGKADTGNDQGVDRIEKYELNAKGEAIKVSYDNNADGNTDAVDNLVLDANGNTLVKYVNADNDTSGTTGQAITLADGRKLTGVDKIETNTLNAKGQVVETLYDNNADGKADSRTEFVRDVNGNVVEEKRDLTNDGQIDKVTKYTLDAQGNQLTRADYNQLADGSQTLTQREEYTLDENGYRTSMTRYTGSGIVGVIEEYEVNALGQVTKKLIDNYGNKVIDRAETYTLDPNGRISKTEIDVGNTGTIDSNTTYIRDPLGQVKEQYIDSNNDGVAETKTTNVYDVYGNVLNIYTDNGNDGTNDRAVSYTYNPIGLRTSARDPSTFVEYDKFNDYNLPEVQHVTTATRQYDIYLRYNEYGLVSYQGFDYNRDGVINNNDAYERIEYDSIWRKRSVITRYNPDDSINLVANFEYDNSGNLVRYFYDRQGNGTIELFAFGNDKGSGTVNHTEDMTSWSDSQLARFNKGLENIVLSDSSAKTDLTLDANVVSKIVSSTNTLTIAGDATDTVNLGNFNAVSTSDKSGYDKFSATVGNTEYTVYIDSDVNTVLG